MCIFITLMVPVVQHVIGISTINVSSAEFIFKSFVKTKPLICCYCRNHISVLLFPNLTSPYKTYRRISTCISNTVCVTCGSIIDYASGAHKCIPVSCGIVVDQFLVFTIILFKGLLFSNFFFVFFMP